MQPPAAVGEGTVQCPASSNLCEACQLFSSVAGALGVGQVCPAGRLQAYRLCGQLCRSLLP